MLADRLIENLFLRAEQVASAMTVRGLPAQTTTKSDGINSEFG